LWLLALGVRLTVALGGVTTSAAAYLLGEVALDRLHPVRLSMLGGMLEPRQEQRLRQAARDAHAAEARGDDAAANEAWRRYRLISDAARDPDELLAEGIALSQMGIELAASDRPHA